MSWRLRLQSRPLTAGIGPGRSGPWESDHASGVEWLAAVRADRPGLDDRSTGLVSDLQRRTAGRGPSVAPLAHGVDDGPQIAALVGEMIRGAGWMLLVRHPGQNAVLDQPVQTLREDIARDAEACLELIEAADYQQCVAHDQQTPPLADDLEALGDRAMHSLKAGSLHRSSIEIRRLHKQTDAIIFDLDGVLLDSESAWEDERRSFVAQHGGRWRSDSQQRLMGMRTAEWAAYRSLIEFALERAQLAPFFQAVVSSDEVAKGKPAPDVYLAAAKRMDIEPTRCAAVEDSSNGLRAAAAAGMRVVAIPNAQYSPAGTGTPSQECCGPGFMHIAPIGRMVPFGQQ
jgi:beta-phosphoglucomutase-like phosphatase (HAD superfamily)